MVFDPKLQGGVAFNQPVAQPNAMEAVAGLFEFGAKSLATSQSNAPKPTEDEKFAMAMREFEASKGGAFSWDRKGMREFIFKYPQFTSQAKAWGEGQSIVPKAPEEIAVDATMEWFKTREGIVAVAYANTLPEEDREPYLREQAGAVAQQEANIAKLTRNSEELRLKGTLEAAQWDVLKPTSRTFVDNTVETVLAPIFQEVLNGVAVDITPEQQAALGIRYDTVDLSNINAVLADTKRYLSTTLNQKYANTFGSDTLASEQWNKEVFSSIDGMVEIGKQFDSPQEQAAFTKALIETEMYKRLDDAGLAVTMRMIEVLPPDTANRLLGTIAGFDEKFANALTGEGSVLGRKGIAQKVNDGSVADAEQLGQDTVEFLDKGYLPEVFTLFKEANAKAGFTVTDEASFRAIIGQHAEEIIKHTNSDPEARTEMSQFLVSDIQGTLSTIESALPTDFDLVVNSQGNFSLVYTGTGPVSRAQAAMGRDAYIAAEMKKAKEALPDGVSIESLNSKLSTLNVLGPLGKEVQEAIGILNKPEEKPKAKSTGGPPKGRGRGRIGESLGIDFETYESEASLPSGYLEKVAMIESGGNPNAKNPASSATGLFQQIDSNAAAYGVVDRTDPVQSTEGAVRFAVENKNYLTKVLGREPSGGELYLAHQQGPGGAAKLLSNPSALAVDIVGLDAVRLNGGDANMTAGEFANIWISKYNGSRGQTVPSSGASEAPISVAIDNPAVGVPESVKGSVASTDSLSVGTLTFDSPEVQQLIERAKASPEEAVKVAKELLAKPIDANIRALIEALVKVGERV